MKLLDADKMQEDRPSSEALFASINLGDSVRIVFDYPGEAILQLLVVESKDEESLTVTGIIDEDIPLDERLVIEDELITLEMRHVFGVMSNDFHSLLDLT